MKKSFLLIAVVGILSVGTMASARPHGGPHGHRPVHHMRPMHHHVMPPMYYHRHRIGCPMYRGWGHRCTCYRYHGSGIYIDFRLPLVF